MTHDQASAKKFEGSLFYFVGLEWWLSPSFPALTHAHCRRKIERDARLAVAVGKLTQLEEPYWMGTVMAWVLFQVPAGVSW